jgi:hypothetical protein
MTAPPMISLMTDPIEITVLPSDIAAGVKEDCHNCPIALAVKRAFPAATHVTVDGQCIDFNHGKQHFYWASSDAIDEFIADFDEGVVVKPFKFAPQFLVSAIPEEEARS